MFITDKFYFISSSDFMLNEKEKDISIIIKTFKRPENLKRLLSSLQRLKCNLPVFVADDSPEPYETEMRQLFPDINLYYNALPFDTGLSEGRNILLRQVTTPYFLLCDDDFIFDRRSRVQWMKRQLIKNRLDILGGVFFEYQPKTKWQWRWHQLKYKLLNKCGVVIPPSIINNYFGRYEINGTECSVHKTKYEAPLTLCDYCHNYFIAKTEAVRNAGGWKKELKVGEHEHFFVKAKMKGLKVATTQEAGIIHGNFYDSHESYFEYRNRAKTLQQQSLKDLGIEKIVNYQEATGLDFG